jgi:predicted nucleotidyltransferase
LRAIGFDPTRSGRRRRSRHPRRMDETAFIDVNSYVTVIAEALGRNLVGVYLHGSAALGDFIPGRSDVDIVAVSGEALSANEKQVVRERLLPLPDLEFHVVRRDTLDAVEEAPPFEVHVGSGRFVDGHGHPGDPDLVLHYLVLRAHGIALTGPPPAELFRPVPRALVQRALARELDWALENASPAYQVLDACRAWRYVEDGTICSKTQAAVWAKSRADDDLVIDQALDHRRGVSDEQPDPERSREFVRNVLGSGRFKT